MKIKIKVEGLEEVSKNVKDTVELIDAKMKNVEAEFKPQIDKVIKQVEGLAALAMAFIKAK